MSEFRLTPDMIGMNNYSMYDPDFCDGEPCPRDCDRCPIADKILEAQEDYDGEPEYDLEMGFDPYLGCYTEDC